MRDPSLSFRYPNPTRHPRAPCQTEPHVASSAQGLLGALCLCSGPPPGDIWTVGGTVSVRSSEDLQSVLESPLLKTVLS